MKKRFVTCIYDGGHPATWQVWSQEKLREGPLKGEKRLLYRYAEFYGSKAQQYARAYARTLNALPPEDQP